MRRRIIGTETSNMEAKVLLSVDEAAALMSLGRSLVYDLVMRREIASIKVGRCRRVPMSALQAYVGRQLSAVSEEA